MTWEFKIAARASKAIKKAPKKDQAVIVSALKRMATDPLDGGCKKLKGYSPTLFRRRVGSWRIFFGLDYDNQTISVFDVLRRTTTTYKR